MNQRSSGLSNQHLKKMGAWIAGVLAAALATAMAGILTGAFDSLTSETDPLTISVDPRTTPCAGQWVVPQPPAQLDSDPGVDLDRVRSWGDWPPAAAGTSASPRNVLFFVQGRSDAEVLLTGLTVRVHERRPPLAGTRLSGQCGDAGAFRWLEVDLDHEPPRTVTRYDEETARFLADEVPDWSLQPIRFPYKVSISEAEPFLIVADTEDCDCTWDAELTWATEGRTGTSVINNNGVPFRTTSTRDVAGTCVVSAEVDCR